MSGNDTINIRVLFFGAAAEIAGQRSHEFSAASETKASDVFAAILADFPEIADRYGDSLLYSINQNYAEGKEVLFDGDELAIFPPVSGG
jgi:molybdopterin converting factor subunit 1